MAVSTAYAPLVYNGNGATVAFSVTFPFFTGTLLVTAVDSTGVETVKTISTHYTVSGGTDANGLPATGTVTMLTAPATGSQLRIERVTPKTQATSYTNNDAFPAKSTEAAFDKLLLIAQEVTAGIPDEITGDVLQLNSAGATDFWDAEDTIIRNVLVPQDDDDAANKEYVDEQVALSAIGSANFTQAGSGASERTWQAKMREGFTGADFGAVGDDSTDDSTAIANARAGVGANRPIELIRGDYNLSLTQSVYGTDFKDALGSQFLLGTVATPATRHEPILWIEKVSASTRDSIATAWDQGAFYGSLEKKSGSAYGAAVTGYALYTGGTGDLVGLHGRARGTAAASQIFGGWSYADCATATPNRVIGHEIDVRNAGAEVTWMAGATTGAISGVAIAVQDGTYGAHHGVRFPNKTDDQQFWTGIQFDQGSIKPVDGSGNGEAIRVRGTTDSADRYGAIALGDGTGTHNLEYGLRTINATFGDNAAIWLTEGQKIVWGATKADTSNLTVSSDVLTLGGGTFAVPLGAEGTPSYSFSGDPNTGWWSPSADIAALSTGGTERLRVNASGNLSFGTATTTRRANIGQTDGVDNAVSYILRLIHETSGTPATGIGAGVEFQVETASGNVEIGATLEALTTDVTSTSEDFDVVIKSMAAGAAAAERVRFKSDGAVVPGSPRLSCAEFATWHRIANSATAIAHTGTTDETVLATVAIPAAAAGANGSIRVTSLWSCTNDASVKNSRHRFGASGAGTGGTAVHTGTLTSTGTYKAVTDIWNRNATNSQMSGLPNGTFASSATALVTAAIDTTAATEIAITAQLADGADTVTLEAYRVEVLYAA
jgi:hypothetical protein